MSKIMRTFIPWRVTATAALVLASPAARASLLAGEALDTMAEVVSWIVLLVVPVGVIVLFWMVHVMPEKIAEKRHHPQQEAIKTLCLLSLFFGGLLWPLAWLWAYAKPVSYRLAYGTDKHESYFIHAVERAEAGQMDAEELAHLRDELDELAQRKSLSRELRDLPARAAAARAAAAAAEGDA